MVVGCDVTGSETAEFPPPSVLCCGKTAIAEEDPARILVRLEDRLAVSVSVQSDERKPGICRQFCYLAGRQ